MNVLIHTAIVESLRMMKLFKLIIKIKMRYYISIDIDITYLIFVHFI